MLAPRPPRVLVIVALVALSLVPLREGVNPALAHGRVLRVAGFATTDEGVVAFTSRGFVRPDPSDAEGRFVNVCTRLYGDSGQGEGPKLAATPEGVLFAGTLAGLHRRAANACVFELVPGPLAGVNISDVFVPRRGASARRLFAVTDEPTPGNVIAHSDDEGATFETFAVGEDRLRSVRASDDGSLVAVAGVTFEGGLVRGGVLWWSDDAGETFVRFEVPLLEEERSVQVARVGLAEVWLSTRGTRLRGARPERLLRADFPVDGSTLSPSNPFSSAVIRAAAPALEGGVWLATAEGVYRVDAAGQATLEYEGAATCVIEGEGAVWICPDLQLGQTVALGRLETDGLSPALDLAEVSALEACATDDDDALCQLDLDDLVRDVGALVTVEPAAGSCAVSRASRR